MRTLLNPFWANLLKGRKSNGKSVSYLYVRYYNGSRNLIRRPYMHHTSTYCISTQTTRLLLDDVWPLTHPIANSHPGSRTTIRLI